MAKAKKPDYYKAPLRSREAMTRFIFEATSQRSGYNYNHQYHPFCFNVKMYGGLDLSFDNLLRKWREYEGDQTYTHNDDWLAAAKAKHAEIGEDTLYEWGVEGAARHYVGGRDGVPDDDGVRSLWDGTEFTVRFGFHGRSSGWLSLEEWEGYKFASRDYDFDYWRDVLLGTDEEKRMDYKTLRKLYQYVVQLKHDLRTEAIRDEVEHNAAFDLFANACADIPQPDYIQPKLFTEEQLSGCEAK